VISRAGRRSVTAYPTTLRRRVPAVAAALLASAIVGCASTPPPTPGVTASGAPAPSAGQPTSAAQTSTPATPTTPPSPIVAEPSPPPATAGPPATAAPSPNAPASPGLTEVLPREAFADPVAIDNPWYPLVPGMQRITKGMSGIGKDRLPHRVLFAVTDLTKVIDGITTRVVYEQDDTDGQPEEEELIFYAQDDSGRVWLMGEYPEEIEEGKVVETPAWLSGVQGATAGILMQATPAADTPSYSEGWGPAVGWNDRARVLETGSRTCVPVRCYDDVLVVDEFNTNEPDAHQLKYYARGDSNVRVGWAGALEDTREELQLTSITQLDAGAMTKLRDHAMVMDARGYKLNPDVYGTTPPLQRAP
jgi:hypothetical protein